MIKENEDDTDLQDFKKQLLADQQILKTKGAAAVSTNSKDAVNQSDSSEREDVLAFSGYSQGSEADSYGATDDDAVQVQQVTSKDAPKEKSLVSTNEAEETMDEQQQLEEEIAEGKKK